MNKNYKEKTLEDLSIIDDFLMQELLNDHEFGEEAARILLETISSKEIANDKTLRNSEEIEAVYDIEVQASEDLGNWPKRSRFYEGTVTTEFLQSGQDYQLFGRQ